MNLLKQTKELLIYMNQLKEIFETKQGPKNMNDQDFFKMVKEGTKALFKLLEVWEADAKRFVSSNNTRVFLPQIIATKENIEVLILHSYYKDLRKRLYMERYNSVLYVLENLLSEIQRVKGK